MSGSTVLITGGSGTLGRALALQMLKNGEYSKIVIFSRDEASQVRMAMESGYKSDRIAYCLGDVNDKESLVRAVERFKVNKIIHTAAVKHVPLAEKQPSEAIATNVTGSKNVLQVALEHGISRVVLVSTDKAAQPHNVYGLTKALMERLMPEYDGLGKLTVNVVRFGNLLGSRGSVLELFLRRIKTEGKVILTDPAMTRFFLRISQAAGVTLHALSHPQSGVVFIPQMRAARMGDVVKAVFEYANVAPNIQVIGSRPGEKIHELILGPDEMLKSALLNDFNGFILRSKAQEKPAITAPISSENAQFMGVDEIISMISEVASELITA